VVAKVVQILDWVTTLAPIVVPLIVVVLTAWFAYVFGTWRARVERREERRDNAIVDVFGAMQRHYRRCITWSRGADPEMRRLTEESYEDFLDRYYTQSIWMAQDTRDVVKAYALEAKDFHNRLSYEMGNQGHLADRTKAEDLLNAKLNPPLSVAEDKLRAELARRPWYRRLFGR
jgi:hypothetical protein